MGYNSIRLRFALPMEKPAGILVLEARLGYGEDAFSVIDLSFTSMADTTESGRLTAALLSAGIGSRCMIDRVVADVCAIGDDQNDEVIWSTILPPLGAHPPTLNEARVAIVERLNRSGFQRPTALQATPLVRVLASYVLVLTLLRRMFYISQDQEDASLIELETGLLFEGIKGI